MKFDAKSIISRLKTALNLKTDEDLSAFLGIARTTVSSWKQRNTLDIQLIIEKCESLDYNHILTNNAKCVPLAKTQNDTPLKTEVDTLSKNISNRELIELVEPYIIKICHLERTIEILKEQLKEERVSVSDLIIKESEKSSERERSLKKSTLNIPTTIDRG